MDYTNFCILLNFGKYTIEKIIYLLYNIDYNRWWALRHAPYHLLKKQKNKERMKLIMNNKKLPYEDAELEVVIFSSEDIVTASDMSNVDPSEDSWV